MPKRDAASGILRLIDGEKGKNTVVGDNKIVNLTEWKRKKEKESGDGEVIKVA